MSILHFPTQCTLCPAAITGPCRSYIEINVGRGYRCNESIGNSCNKVVSSYCP